MLKFLALITLAISGITFGTMLCKEEKTRIDKINELLSFVTYILWSVEHKGAPISQMLDDYRKETDRSEKSDFLKDLSLYRGTLGEKIINITQGICTIDAIRDMSDFCLTLGSVDKDTQIKKATKAVEVLTNELEKAKAEYASKSRLYKMLPFLCSCVVGLVLY